jgi:hypothetical protein
MIKEATGRQEERVTFVPLQDKSHLTQLSFARKLYFLLLGSCVSCFFSLVYILLIKYMK